MAHLTFVARAADGLLLAEATDEGGRVSNHVRRQALELLASLHSASPRCSIEVGLGLALHLTVAQGVCCLGVFDGSYPWKFAFAFLEELRGLFQEELKRRFGTSVDHRSQVETVERPHHFAGFERQITRLTGVYRDPSTSRALSRLHAHLLDVSSVTRRSLDEFLRPSEGKEPGSDKEPALTSAASGLVALARRGATPLLLLVLTALLLTSLGGAAAATTLAQGSLWVAGAVLIAATLAAARSAAAATTPRSSRPGARWSGVGAAEEWPPVLADEVF